MIVISQLYYRIKELGLNTSDSSVAFGQQLGMSDNLTFTLGQL